MGRFVLRGSLGAALLAVASLAAIPATAQTTPAIPSGFKPAVSERLAGRLVAAVDGDTIRFASGERYFNVRLADIDAPELGQDHGREARGALLKLCLGANVEIITTGTDRHGRIVARVLCNGIDAAEYMIGNGHAWAYREYLTRQELIGIEKAASHRRAGLWAAGPPMPPWEWRPLQQLETAGQKLASPPAAAALVGAGALSKPGPILWPGAAVRNESAPRRSRSQLAATLRSQKAESSGGDTLTLEGMFEHHKTAGQIVEETYGTEGYYGPTASSDRGSWHTGPRGGRYTITSSGNKNYNKPAGSRR